MKPIKIIYLIFSLLLFVIDCFGQENLDVKVDPTPYRVSGYMGKQDNKSVKRRIYIIDYNIKENNSRDTMTIQDYDIIGNEIKHHAFSHGKKEYEITYEYYPKQKLRIWRRPEYNHEAGTVDRTWYYSNDKIKRFENANFRKADTIDRGVVNFTYNKDSLLVLREDMAYGKIYLTKIYNYNGKDMVDAETKMGGNPNYNGVLYKYNADHLPVSQTKYYMRPNGRDTLLSHLYFYEDKKLISEQYKDGLDPKKDISVSYTYDKNNRILAAMSKEDTLYRQTSFEYAGPYLSKVTVTANNWSKLSREWFIFGPTPLTKMPMTYETTYYYDDKGYLIKTEDTLNGVLQMRKLYVIEYY